ncbi:MAG: bifunctional 4-hydroxy-2-oxoglutarate aldolase/2-dehydro-3-deoxy-phosphogluconate aldolase [Abditibacteriota bacterium]|nr:bifunctional 4-hydroxy-2-oxoglutarate aldolase/2-dehydro-3-deoxy-phosphogluconate aldolase [Abditibacteriota bacterium]
MTVTEQLSATGIIPVIRLDDPDDALPLGEALLAGGVNTAEITFRAAGADRAIRLMSEHYPEILVGAGTVLKTDQVSLAADSGARFIVSPGFNPKTAHAAIIQDLPVYPGVCTPTEIEAAMEYGLTTLKFFPAGAFGGVKTLKALSGPYGMVKFIPTGGVSLSNLAEYVSCPATACVGGTYIATAEFIRNRDWQQITELCRKSLEIISECRQTK